MRKVIKPTLHTCGAPAPKRQVRGIVRLSLAAAVGAPGSRLGFAWIVSSSEAVALPADGTGLVEVYPTPLLPNFLVFLASSLLVSSWISVSPLCSSIVVSFQLDLRGVAGGRSRSCFPQRRKTKDWLTGFATPTSGGCTPCIFCSAVCRVSSCC